LEYINYFTDILRKIVCMLEQYVPGRIFGLGMRLRVV